MNISRNNFRLIAITSLLLVFVAIAIEFFSLSNLPPELESYVQKEDSNNFETSVLFIPIIIFAFMALIGNIGLIFFAKWSPAVFTIGVIVTALGTLTYGPSVQTALQTTFYEIDTMFTGFIIALLYFSNVRTYFKNENT